MEKSQVEKQLERLEQEQLLARIGKTLIDNIPNKENHERNKYEGR